MARPHLGLIRGFGCWAASVCATADFCHAAGVSISRPSTLGGLRSGVDSVLCCGFPCGVSLSVERLRGSPSLHPVPPPSPSLPVAFDSSVGVGLAGRGVSVPSAGVFPALMLLV